MTFKKFIVSLILGVIVTLNTLPLAFAQDGKTPPAGGSTGGAAGGGTATADVANPSQSQLLPQFQYTVKGTDTNVSAQTKIGAVNALPNKPWQEVITGVVKILLNISGSLTLIALTAGGVFMVTANGNAEAIGKGKKIVAYSIAGLVVIAVSYAIVIGVAELQFFTPGTASTNGGTTNGSTSAPSTPAPAQGTGPGAGAGA